jgi:hypothetical protein
MDLGTGVTASTAIVIAGASGIKIVSLYFENRRTPQKAPAIPCPDHAGLLERLKNGDGKFDEFKKDVKAIKKALLMMATDRPLDNETLKGLMD